VTVKADSRTRLALVVHALSTILLGCIQPPAWYAKLGSAPVAWSWAFRVVIFYRRGARAFFVHGFAKSERANISQDELAALKELATAMLAYNEGEITKAVASGPLIEVICNE
jgi:hypothetical protein